MTTVGSLFTGYGGLDMGVMIALDSSARIAWTSDVEPGPCKLAAVRWPDTPNLGDITRVDWDAVEPVDIICGGSPCQDISVAGKRTSSPYCPGSRPCGRRPGHNRVDVCWRVVRASDVGSPHQRARLFVIGYPHGEPWDLRRATGTSEAARGWPLSHPARSGLGDAQHVAGTLLPTPQATNASRSSAGYGPNLHEIATSADLTEFGPYAEAIARWETITGREAPPPSTASRRPGGKPQLSARFVEWLMGLPDGHVTGADLALPREQQLRLLGNGVVPQQSALAVRTLTETALRYGATS